MEGNTMTLDETFMLIKEGISAIDKHISDQVEIVNYHKSYL